MVDNTRKMDFKGLTLQMSAVEADTKAKLAAADVDGSTHTVSTNVALGNYANAFNAKLDFGTTGRVTGLGGAVCSELDLGAGTTQGSYACFEAELNVPTGGKTGTRTSFLTLNVWGADVATFDTNGFIFDLNGVTAGSAKVFNTGNTHGTPAASLRIKIGSTNYFIPLNSTQVSTT